MRIVAFQESDHNLILVDIENDDKSITNCKIWPHFWSYYRLFREYGAPPPFISSDEQTIVFMCPVNPEGKKPVDDQILTIQDIIALASIPVYSPADIYAMEAESITSDVYGMLDDHVNEYSPYDLDCDAIEKDGKLQIKTIKYHNYDGRRDWDLRTVWFDGNPVMIIQNAGREGDDHKARYITSKDYYIKMVQYLATFLAEDTHGGVTDDVVDINHRHPQYGFFYGQHLNGKFKRH